MRRDLISELTSLVNDFEREFYIPDKNSVRIYISKTVQRILINEFHSTTRSPTVELKEFMGYKILPGYDHKVVIANIDDVGTNCIKQLQII